jgi:hypothetical protein
VTRAIRIRSASTLTVATLVLALGFLAFLQNQSVVRDIVWPGLDIQYREFAGAQTILEQGYGPDAAYAGERTWYNPMAIWLIAGLSRVSGAPPSLLIARSGPYINLIAPASLFVLVTVLFDQFAALAAVAAFIFAVGTGFPFIYSATYSPWFAPENFAQAWLYISIAFASVAFDRERSSLPAIAGGVLLGATFLTHAAPALIGGVVWVILAARESYRSTRRAEPLGRLALALGIAFLVSLPFTVQILGHYHLAIVNRFPGQSPSDLLDLNELPSLARQLLALPVVLAVGALGYRAVGRRDRGTEVVLALLAAVFLFLAAHVARLLIEKAGVRLPSVVPDYHFFFYLMAVVSIGVGLALRDLGGAVAAWLRKAGDDASRLEPVGGLVTCGLAVLLVAGSYSQYRDRVDFTKLRQDIVAANTRFPSDVVDWIRTHSRPEDVFLTTDDASLYMVSPAGRKVVATNRYFSNPYVDWLERDADRRAMFDRLAHSDPEGFWALARKYGVDFVVVSADRSPEWLKASGMTINDLPVIDPEALGTLPGFTLAFHSKRFDIVALGHPDRPAGLQPHHEIVDSRVPK